MRERVSERVAPLLCTIASEGAECMALKSGLTAADLLRPFAADLRSLGQLFRTPSAPFTVRELGFSAHPPSDLLDGSPAAHSHVSPSCAVRITASAVSRLSVAGLSSEALAAAHWICRPS